MVLDDLHHHPLFAESWEDIRAIQKACDLDLMGQFDESTAVDELQFYKGRVSFALAHLLGWVAQLHHAVLFLSEFRYSKKASNAGVSKAHHLLYNVENYLVRLVSVYDRCLQLTNAVFHLCMSDELVNHGALVSNLHVARTDVPARLKAVRKAIKPVEQERHILVHRHSHMDPELRRIEMMYLFDKDTWGSERGIPFENLVHMRGQLVRKFTARRKREFDAINTELVTALGPLFDALLDEYHRQKSRLGKLV